MEDPIEELIRKHRDELDLHEPPEVVWKKISEEYEKRSEPQDHTLIWKAAAVILLFVSGVLAYNLTINPRTEPDPRLLTLGEVAREYRTEEQQYEDLIKQLKAQVDFENINREEFDWIFEELEYLEQSNLQFREDLEKVGKNERLIGILLNYY
jgi:hypothetical protein